MKQKWPIALLCCYILKHKARHAEEFTVLNSIKVTNTDSLYYHAIKTLKSVSRLINCSGWANAFDVLRMLSSVFIHFKDVHGPVWFHSSWWSLCSFALMVFSCNFNRCIYSVNVQRGWDCLIVCRHRASCYISWFMSASYIVYLPECL